MTPTETSPLRGGPAPRKSRLALLAGAVVVSAVVLSLVTMSSRRKPAAEVSVSARAPNAHDVTCGIAKTEAGYIQLTNKKADNYFYWFYESRSDPSTDPLVVWLTGGPGCSSLMALLTENGPCTVNEDLSTTINPFAWNAHANVIWLDQPSNVGFSYALDESDADKDENDVGDNFFVFLNAFLDKHPEFEGREFFVTGESYAGHYVPAVARKILLENEALKAANATVRINLQGIAIGNGIINPEIQSKHVFDILDNSYNITLMSPEDYARMKELEPKCNKIIQEIVDNGDDLSVLDDDDFECELVYSPFKKAKRDQYDIRKICDEDDCEDMTLVTTFLNSEPVRKFLNLTDDPKKEWTECQMNISMDFVRSGDTERNYAGYVAELLNTGVRVLIYAGDADMACNWSGNKAWTTALEWQHKAEFNAAEDRAFVTGNGSVNAGAVKAYKSLFTFLRLYNSGHMVPRDQPAVALEMIEKFFHGEAF